MIGYTIGCGIKYGMGQGMKGNIVTSIDDFVNRRWTDAKRALRELDPDFVSSLESEHCLQLMGLSMPRQYGVEPRPDKSLSTEWHRLLEACHELTMQACSLQMAAVSMTADANRGMSQVEVGKRADYHFRSWFIHGFALAERTEDVIKKTADVYVDVTDDANEVTKRYHAQVTQRVTRRIKDQRNTYAHGGTRSWGSGITEDHLWEGMVTIRVTPKRFLAEFHYPAEADFVTTGKYDGYVEETEKILDCLGSILQELEMDPVIKHCARHEG